MDFSSLSVFSGFPWALGIPLSAGVVDPQTEVELALAEAQTSTGLPVSTLWPEVSQSRGAQRFAPVELVAEELYRSLESSQKAAFAGLEAQGMGMHVSLGLTAQRKSPAVSARQIVAKIRKGCAEQWNRTRLAVELGAMGFPALINILEKSDSDRRLAKILRCSPSVAREIWSSWQSFLHAKPPLLGPQQWEQPQGKIREDLEKALLLRKENNLSLDPSLIADLLENGNAVARATFHNVVMGTGHDFPRESRAVLRKSLQRLETMGQLRISIWETFWEAQADAIGWRKKPYGAGLHYFLYSAILYARAAGWSLTKMHEWLAEYVRLNPAVRPILHVFDATIDQEVLDGKRYLPRERPTLAELKASMPWYSGSRTNFTGWVHQWENFARDLKMEAAIRPQRKEVVLLLERMQQGRARKAAKG